jgi:hypothetical protein
LGERTQPRKARSQAPQRPAAKPRPSAPKPTSQPLLALVNALVALLSAHGSKRTMPPAGLALLVALGALLDAVQAALAAPGKTRLVAHTSGPLVGLELQPAATDDSDDELPAPVAIPGNFPNVDPAGGLAFEVAAVLDRHRRQRSEAHGALWSALSGTLDLVQEWLAAPEGKALNVFGRSQTDGDGLPPTELRLVPSEANERPASPPPKATTLESVHRRLLHYTSEGIDSLSNAVDSADICEMECDGLQGGMANGIRDGLESLRSDLCAVRLSLCSIAAHLSGEEKTLSMVGHALALGRLLAALESAEARARDDQVVLQRAAHAFAGTKP